MSVEVRPFRRDDREGLTALVNAHVAAVVPGLSVSVNTVLAHLERDPGEFVVDPWVTERMTLVAEQRRRVVAAAHLLRYGGGDEVGESYRDAGEIRWLLYWPEAPYWPDSGEAADALLAACLAQLERWGVPRQYASGQLPAPGAYDVSDRWPHVRAAYERAGFTPAREEIVYLARVEDLPRVDAPPLDGVELRRSLGTIGTRLAALRGEELLGFVEVDLLDDGGRLPRHGGWADVGNLWVREDCRRQGLATWLVARAADWFRLARVDRVLDYAGAEDEACRAFLESLGYSELTCMSRGWSRPSAR